MYNADYPQALNDSLRIYFSNKQGRGEFCAVEHHEYQGKHYTFAYPSNYFEETMLYEARTFKGTFSSAIAKTVLLDYWQGITADMPVLVASGFNSEDLYRALAEQTRRPKPGELLQLVGALSIASRIGMNGLRQMVESFSTPRTWQRLKKLLHEQDINTNMRFNPLRVAEGHLRAFEALRLEDYLTKSNKLKIG